MVKAGLFWRNLLSQHCFWKVQQRNICIGIICKLFGLANAGTGLSKRNKNRSKCWILKLHTTSMIDVRLRLQQSCCTQHNSKFITVMLSSFSSENTDTTENTSEILKSGPSTQPEFFSHYMMIWMLFQRQCKIKIILE